MGRKLRGNLPPFWAGKLGPHLAQCGLNQGPPPCQVPPWYIQPFGHNRHGPKIGKGAPSHFGGRGAGSPSNTKSPGLRPCSISSGILIDPAIWPQQIWAENWGACPFEGGRAGSPSNTMWPGPRPTCMPSFILIHPTVWPQYTNITDTTDRQDKITTRNMVFWTTVMIICGTWQQHYTYSPVPVHLNQTSLKHLQGGIQKQTFIQLQTKTLQSPTSVISQTNIFHLF